MSRKIRRETGAAGLSFLDCICCGFGAVILLLVIVKVHDPIFTREQRVELVALIARLKAQILDVERDTETVQSELDEARSETERLESEAKALAARLAALRGSQSDADVVAALQAAAKRAEQKLSTEVERLRRYQRAEPGGTVAGIPADSEYIIFVIDTSPSMQNYNWGLVQRKLSEALEAYPTVKGIQVMNDDGRYMFPDYQGRWIPDSEGRRQAIVSRMRTWNATSDSDPVDGIQAAIETFWAADKKISVYVFGDDFQGNYTVDSVVATIDRLNRAGADGERRVRLHAVGFPRGFRKGGEIPPTAIRFSTLMRVLCDRNGGTFVALTDPNS